MLWTERGDAHLLAQRMRGPGLARSHLDSFCSVVSLAMVVDGAVVDVVDVGIVVVAGAWRHGEPANDAGATLEDGGCASR